MGPMADIILNSRIIPPGKKIGCRSLRWGRRLILTRCANLRSLCGEDFVVPSMTCFGYCY
jgi:hypothetical protein